MDPKIPVLKETDKEVVSPSQIELSLDDQFILDVQLWWITLKGNMSNSNKCFQAAPRKNLKGTHSKHTFCLPREQHFKIVVFLSINLEEEI